MTILIFTVGLISSLLVVAIDITKFKNDMYEHKIFKLTEIANGDILNTIVYIVSILPILLLLNSIFKAIYALVLILILVLDKTILNCLKQKRYSLIS